MQACVDVAFPYAHLREALSKKKKQVSSSYYRYLSAPLALQVAFSYFSVCLSSVVSCRLALSLINP